MSSYMNNEVLYVAFGSKGLVKVGRTKDIKLRQSALRRDFKLVGEAIEHIEVTRACGYALSYEQELINFALQHGGKPVFGREYFRGIPREECIALAHKLAAAGEARYKAEEERVAAIEAEDRAIAAKRQATRAANLNKLKAKHFEEFLAGQRAGTIPIPLLDETIPSTPAP